MTASIDPKDCSLIYISVDDLATCVRALGRNLTRPALVREVRAALQAAGLNQANYAGHSFRIGAVTTAAADGINDGLIKTLAS